MVKHTVHVIEDEIPNGSRDEDLDDDLEDAREIPVQPQ